MYKIENLVRQLRTLESNRRKEDKSEKKRRDYSKDYSSRNKQKSLESERRRTAEKLSLWGDIKKWRNELIRIPEVQRVLNKTFVMIIYQDNLRGRGLSVDLYRSGDLHYETNCHKFVSGLGTSFILDDATAKRASLEFLKGFHNSLKSGKVHKKILRLASCL